MFRAFRKRSFVALCIMSTTLMQTFTCPISQAYSQRSLTTTLLSNLSGIFNDTLFFIIDSTFVNLS